MSGDYISREAATSAFLSERPDAHYPGWYAAILMDMPAADVAPVVHGRWVEKKGGFWEIAACSNCGEKSPTLGITPKYCPHCGAKMDGGTEDG